MTTLFRLKANTVVEPLANSWVAYSHNVSPLSASLSVSHYQIPNLRQYLASPASSIEACKNPKLRAGRFVNFPEERAHEIKSFLEHTETEYKENLSLVRELMRFQNLLVATGTTGLPLAPFYTKLPEELRGYVELLYDYFTRPSVRVIEPLLYESKYYKPYLQSLRLFSLNHDRDRDFIFSTPRLPSAGEIHWRVPFDDPRVDKLFKLDVEPKPFEEIRELLGLDASSNGVLAGLLDEHAPPRPEAWTGDGARVRHFGHACVLIEWKGASLLIDPCISVHPSEGDAGRPSFDELPERIDYALITHNHHDHYSLESLLRIRHKLGCLVVPRAFGLHYGDVSLKLLSQRLGFPRVVELDTLERIPLPDGEIVAVPFLGEHADLPHAKTAYVVRVGTHRMLFAADSDCFDPRQYERLREILGPVRSVFLGLECVGAPMSWSCGAFFPIKPTVQQDQSRRQHGCDAERGMKLVEALQARHLYIYAMGLEPWYEWLLGLAYTEDATQIQESKKIISMAQNRGMDAKLISAPTELLLHSE
jgi:L-ascorbate metabolism protein UlaG (beta-lactamase superfamily)